MTIGIIPYFSKNVWFRRERRKTINRDNDYHTVVGER
jgi:hypothetical protein